MRHLASGEDIKQAYRLRVLQFHPDKVAQRNGGTDLSSTVSPDKKDAFFKCIQKAYEILSDPERRQQYDSVDASFDENIPKADLRGADFFASYGPVFERNARFSKILPVPLLGSATTSREFVEKFYAFWSNFDSWRRFEYLDEEDVETGENRADKRWVEKKNRAARTKLKNDDNARLRRLFEQAYKADPRVAAFKEQDRLAKDAAKNARFLEQRKAQYEAEAARAELESLQKAEFEARKASEAQAKKDREALQSALKAEKRAFKQFWADASYFVAEPTRNLKRLENACVQVETAIQKLSLHELQDLLKRLKPIAYPEAHDEMMSIIVDAIANVGLTEVTAKPVTEREEKEKNCDDQSEPEWGLKEMDILINACRQFPGGSINRWESIVEWTNRHLSNAGLPERSFESIRRRALLTKVTASIPTSSSHNSILDRHDWEHAALQKKKRDPRIDQSEPTINADAPVLPASKGKAAVTSPATTSASAMEYSSPWTADEQKKLEAAMKAIEPSDDRWDRIAQSVGSRSKKECMARAKEIALALKQKRRTAA